MTYQASWRHERILRRPKREDRRSAQARDGQEPSRPHLLRESLLRQTLRQTRRGGPLAGAQEQARLKTQDRRASQQVARRGHKGASFDHPPKEVRVPVNGTMRRKAKSTCTPGSITRSSFSSSISSRAVRSCLSSPVRSSVFSNSRSLMLFTPWRLKRS